MAGSGQTVLILRANHFDDELATLARGLQRDSGMAFCVVADETRGALEVPADLRKIGVSDADLDALGLLRTWDTLDRCGDYALYMARRSFPEATHYWIMRPELRINFRSIGEFFALYDGHADVDFIASYFEPAAEHWPWRDRMTPFASRVYRCMYPLVRLSGASVDLLLSRRQWLTKLFRTQRGVEGQLRDPGLWPNDEGFTATELVRNGFRCEDINFTGRIVYDPATFSFDRPIPASRFATFPADGRLYYPVQRGAHFLHSIRSMFEHVRNSNAPVEQIQAMFGRPGLLDDISSECGGAEAERFAADYAQATGAGPSAPDIASAQLTAELSSAMARIAAAPDSSTHEVRAELVRVLWRGQDPFANFPRHLFEYDLQGWGSTHPYLVEAVQAARPRIVVEVGVWKGGSTLTMAAKLKELGLDGVVIAIDTWLGAWDHWINDEHHPQLSFVNGMPTIYYKFANNVITSGLRDYVVPLPLDSLNAVHVLRHYGVRPDVVHIDGGHDYHAVLADLREWWPQVNHGGWLIGDDYHVDGAWPGVRQAFDEFFGGLDLAPFEFGAGKCRIRKS